MKTKKRAVQADGWEKKRKRGYETNAMQEGSGLVGAPVAPLTVLGDLRETKNLWLQSLKTKRKKGRVRVRSRNFRVKEK